MQHLAALLPRGEPRRLLDSSTGDEEIGRRGAERASRGRRDISTAGPSRRSTTSHPRRASTDPHDVGGHVGSGSRSVGTIALWPLEIDEGFVGPATLDPWAWIVRRTIDDLRLGRVEEALASWHPDATWEVRCAPAHGTPLVGPEAVVDHHRTLGLRTGQTFRQRLFGLAGSAGPIVTAYVRSHARMGHRILDQPALITFELTGGRIRKVIEMPGDVADWCSFWSH